MNLDTEGAWLTNLKALYENRRAIYGYEHRGEYLGPTLMLNGAESFQKDIQSDLKFY